MIALSFRKKNLIIMPVTAGIMLVGLTLALLLIPDDPTPAGVLAPSAFAMCAVLLAYPVGRIALGGLLEVLRCDVAVLIGFTYLALGDVIQSYFSFPLDSGALAKCYVAFALFAAAFIFGTNLPRVRLPRVVNRLTSADYSVIQLFLMTIVFFAVGMFNYLLFSNFSISTMVEGLLSPRFAAPWSRGALGGWNAFSDFMTNCGFLLPLFTVFLKLKTGRWSSPSVIIGLLCSAIFLMFLSQSGGRRLLAVTIGAPLLTWILTQRARLNLRHVIVAVLVITGLVIGMEYMMNYRAGGYGSADLSSFEVDRIRVDENLVTMGQLMSAIPAEEPYVTWRYPLYALTLPVPRVLWSGKPTGPGFSLADYVNGDNNNGTSYTVTCVGEWYMAFGFLGIALGGLLQGALANSWEALIKPGMGSTGAGLYGLGVMIQIAGCRSTYELELMSYCLVFWIVGDFSLNLFRNGRRKVPYVPKIAGSSVGALR